MSDPPETVRPTPSPGPRPESFDAAALQYLDPLYGMAMRLTRNPVRAQDLVQDTYVKAFRHWQKFEPGTNLKAWLFKILTNTFLNDIKKHRHDARAVDFDEVEEFTLGAALRDDDPNVRGDRTMEQFLADVVDQHVKSAIDDLREPFRTAFLLVDLEEFSYQEAADILGVQIGTIRSRLFRGRAFLSERLRTYAIESGVVSPDTPLRRSEGAE